MHNNSRGKKQEVEDQRRSVKLSKNKTSVTACNNSLNAKTLNVKSVSAMCDKCVLIDEHVMCVLNSVDKPIKKTVASKSNQKPSIFTRKLYEHASKTCSWWYSKFTPSGYKWKPKSGKEIVNPNISMPLGNASRTANVMDTMTSRRSTVSKTPLSSNYFAARRDCSIHRLNHTLFSVGQFYDADLEVAFRKSTCFICDLKGNDLLTGSRGTDLYSITLQDTNCPNPICLMAKATSSQAWLWHRHLSHLNFNTINLLSKNDIVKGFFAKRPLLEHLNKTALSKDGTEHLDGENLDKMKEKCDECIFVGYSTQSRAYRVFHKRTRVIMESIHVNFDELPHIATNHSSSDPAPECLVPQQQKASDYDNPDPVPQRQEVSSLADADVPSQQELDLLFKKGEHLQDDKFTNPFCAPAQEEVESTSHNIGNSNVPTYNQPQVSEYQWTKDHPLEQESSLWIEASSKGVARYTLEILHKHGMNKGQSIGTPMATKPKLDADLSGNPVDQTDYRSKIRSLMYLTSSRPDIVQAVCFCAGYQSRPTKKHLKKDKMIFRYLRGTVNMGLWYPKGSSFELTAFQMLIMPDALILAKALLEEFNS
nr:uncharacterized mitochondrial protein AtMg00810-like [Tanacetum cinerariifolium]